jgi:hypothetical protein
MKHRAAAILVILLMGAGSAQAQVRSLWKWPKDPRTEFVQACTAHMVGRWEHPDAVCGCLHDHAIASVDDSDLRAALLHGISETGVPTIENDRIPASKQSLIAATFDRIAKPALQCMFEPLE